MLNLFFTALSYATAAAADCQQIDGMYYCDETNLIQFENVGTSGSYNRVTAFNNDGTCSFTPQEYSGTLAPFNEELSVHFRGPINLDQFKVFTKSASPQKKRALHHRHADGEVVTHVAYLTEYVTVYADEDESEGTTTSPEVFSSTVVETTPTSAAAEPTSAAPSSSAAPAANGDGWTQIANYNADSQQADGLVFLNNFGGTGSGVFDFQFGNSLSYMSSDASTGASSPQVLSKTTVGSNKEFAIFTGTECQGDDCGFYRPGNVAYHGFGGEYKAFFFEFSMPHDGTSGFNADMPAVWLLNAQIPRNLQYGAQSCSCWSTGCGELDLWEVLSSGNTHCVTTLHGKQNGGGSTPNYFARPSDSTLKGAAIFQGGTVTIVRVDEIPETLDDSMIQSWIQQAGPASTINM